MKNISKNQKIILEIILIAICLGFLLFSLLSKYDLLVLPALISLVCITLLEIFAASAKKSFQTWRKLSDRKIDISTFVLSFLLLFGIFYQMINKNSGNTLNIAIIAGIVLLLCYLLFKVFSNIKNINPKKTSNDKKSVSKPIPLYKSVMGAVLSLVSFVLILISLLFSLFKR